LRKYFVFAGTFLLLAALAEAQKAVAVDPNGLQVEMTLG
jgi:hypothetical protein